MTERRYLPTIADLIDRLSIVLMKSVFIPENRDKYRDEMLLIMHDIGTTSAGLQAPNLIYAVLVLMLANRFIWENEAIVREGGLDEGHRLRMTHAVNGVRNRAKNKIAAYFGERVDLKVDCLAGDLPKEYGNWDVF
jgi:hypothetical protein